MEDALLYSGYSTMLVDKLGARIGSPEMQSENFELACRRGGARRLCRVYGFSFVRAARGEWYGAPSTAIEETVSAITCVRHRMRLRLDSFSVECCRAGELESAVELVELYIRRVTMRLRCRAM